MHAFLELKRRSRFANLEERRCVIDRSFSGPRDFNFSKNIKSEPFLFVFLTLRSKNNNGLWIQFICIDKTILNIGKSIHLDISEKLRLKL